MHVDFQMVLQVRPHAGPVGHHRDAMLAPDAPPAPMPDSISSFGELIDEAASDHLARGADHLDLAAALHLDPDGAAVFDHHAAGKAADHAAHCPSSSPGRR